MELPFPLAETPSDAQLERAALLEKLDAVTFALGMQDTADMPTTACFDQRKIERNELAIVRIKAPVEQPRSLNRKLRGRGVLRPRKVFDDLFGTGQWRSQQEPQSERQFLNQNSSFVPWIPASRELDLI